MHPTLSTVVIV